MSAPKEILKLVEQFDRNLPSYKSGVYNETQLRREFLDPFFKSLGWDMDNAQGLAEAYKDVIHEDAIRIGGAIKAPDYGFRIGGTRKFFLEAKKPSADIAGEISPAFQLRRYAWSAHLPLSILSDFEEFAVYDCRVKPKKNDSAATARVFLCGFRDYPEKWDWIASVFSKDAVLKGSFDKYAETNKTKRGTAEVDDDFLATIEGWRTELAKNLALRNPRLSQRELNFAVQRIIDRIIFLRICEDRGIENYGRLLALTNGPHIYKRLGEVFEDADAKYNSGLFHFEPEKGRNEPPDELTLGLNVDDKLLRDLFKGLYYPESPYEFTVLTSDILGQVYEQFLGKVIRLTAGHHAVIEDKPEVKKAGGVYYTPTYIVDYIVRQTIGKLVENKAPKQIEKIRVLDPACGSGSFLINAYQFLLDWHRDWYTAHTPGKWAAGRDPQLVQTTAGWKLTISERKRILLNNIFGVDIDPQAVEVTKLSLLLKVLEGESEQTIQPFLRLFQQRALPDLGNNIKCGNSLIGPDFYRQKELPDLTEEDRLRINVFDWDAEFPEIMKAGGFDAVIGNPPYVRIQTMKDWAPAEVELFKEVYRSAASGNYDIYVVFIERALSLLNRSGRIGFILPHKFLNAQYGENIRQIISSGDHLSQIVHFGDKQVFANATTYTCLLFLDKKPVTDCTIKKVTDLTAWRSESACTEGSISSNEFTKSEWNISLGAVANLLKKLRSINTQLGALTDIFVGLQTSADKIFIIPNSSKIEKAITKRILLTGGLRPYSETKTNSRLIFPYEIGGGKACLIQKNILEHTFPICWEYLISHRNELQDRNKGKMKHKAWYAYVYPKNLIKFEEPKIIVQVTAKYPTFLIDRNKIYFTGGGSGPFYGIRPYDFELPLEYLLGILNSSLFGWVVKTQSTNLRGGYYKYSKQYIETAPIVTRRQAGNDNTNSLIRLVQIRIALGEKIDKSKSPHEMEFVERQIESINKEIDRLVYELYDLTEDEIKIVEESD